ncbi:glycosyltransferase 87 family protein [Streptomyces monticola]|uniref:Glycosyltransferase 87 family protein n=1 Tax=Streptomyces monticola TaxID=2666263 RepID=A0ABW2JEK8_9ACTN
MALALATLTDLLPHRVWGLVAAPGYAAAALAALRHRHRHRRRPRPSAVPAVIALLGTVALPLIALVALGLRQLEVTVVERSAHLLLTTGSPYVDNPSAVADFNPYLPGMALFGVLPGDARWWLGGMFAATLAGAVVVAGRGRGRGPGGWAGQRVAHMIPDSPQAAARRTHRPLYLIACALIASPLVALPLAVGGIDLPVAGLLCLGLALAGRDRPAVAGLALGAASALKWTAWPALPVALALIAVRQGRGPALRYAAVATVTAGTVVLPFALTHPSAFYANVVAFPLGLTETVSPAASPLPGHLLTAFVPGGRMIALVLLSGSALLLAVSLVVRPPATATAAAHRLALGLALAMCLMPATRFGYLVYPVVLWVMASGTPDRSRPLPELTLSGAEFGIGPRVEVAAVSAAELETGPLADITTGPEREHSIRRKALV